MDRLNIIRCFILVVLSAFLSRGAVDADPLLRMACIPSDDIARPAVFSPIWLDLVVTNYGDSQFNGQVQTTPDLGVTITPSAASQLLLRPLAAVHYFDIMCVAFHLDPGKSRTFRILLDEFYTPLRPGDVSGTVSLPLSAPTGDRRAFVQGSFSIHIGKALTRSELGGVVARLRKNLIVDQAALRLNPNYRLEAVRSLRALPDEFALPVLETAIQDSDSSVQYTALLVLRDRPFSPGIRKLLNEAAKSLDDQVKSTAQQILARKT